MEQFILMPTPEPHSLLDGFSVCNVATHHGLDDGLVLLRQNPPVRCQRQKRAAGWGGVHPLEPRVVFN